MQANYYNVLQADDQLSHLTGYHNHGDLETVRVKSKSGIKNMPSYQYIQNSQTIMQMKIIQPQNAVPQNICSSSGEITFDLKQGIGNAHLIKHIDLMVEFYNNTTGNIDLVCMQQFLSNNNAVYFSDGSDNVSSTVSSFALSFLNQYLIPDVILNADTVKYRNYPADKYNTNNGNNLPPLQATRTYCRVKNPYCYVPIRDIKGDFYVTFNFNGDTTHFNQNDAGVTVSKCYLILTTEQLTPLCLKHITENRVAKTNCQIITKYIPINAEMVANTTYSVQIDFNKSIFGVVWFIQPQAKYNSSGFYQQNIPITFVKSYDLTNSSGELITSQQANNRDDLQYYHNTTQFQNHQYFHVMPYNHYWFGNDVEKSIQHGIVTSMFSLKQDGLNLNFTTSDFVSSAKQQVVFMLFTYSINELVDGKLVERIV